jgi:predicted ATPase
MRNFKVFEDETMPLRNLNVLTGLNSSGKSSVIQALRMLNIQGLTANMGTWKEFTRYEKNTLELAISRNKKDHYDFDLLLEYKRRENEFVITNCSNNPFYNNNHSNSLGFVSYISADRYGPKNVLPLRTDDDVLIVGEYGEYIIDFLESISNRRNELLVVPDNLAIGESSIMHNIITWLSKISPGIKMESESFERTDMGRVKWNGFRAAHVGFGLSYTLPIIASVLVHSAQVYNNKVPCNTDNEFGKNVLLLIENPEAHLHPAGQTLMGKLLAYSAGYGVQIVVETHSDHLLNGMRIAVKEGKLSHKDMGCLFFNLPPEGNEMFRDAVKVEDIRIDEYGMLDYWPANFFDEIEKNFLELL